MAGDQVGAPQFRPAEQPTAAASRCHWSARRTARAVTGPELVDTEKAVLKIARADLPDGLVVHSAGAGGVLVAFIDAFNGLDGTLLLAAGLVVIVILLFVYRSPVLWFFPLFSAALALGAAALVIYPLAKNDMITLNGQSQGILSVLVIGAGTDYALLLISRYREELHTYESRIDAMIAAWKGAAPPIGASALTVILGLLCLTVADLKSTARPRPGVRHRHRLHRADHAGRAAGDPGVLRPVDLLAQAPARRPRDATSRPTACGAASRRASPATRGATGSSPASC